MPYRRDRAWLELYHKYKGQIDEQFGFLAFRTAPLVSAYTVDAKVVTSEMASHMMVWAAFGKPNQREWVPRKSDLRKGRRALSFGLLPVPGRTVCKFAGHRQQERSGPDGGDSGRDQCGKAGGERTAKLRRSRMERMGAACQRRRHVVRSGRGVVPSRTSRQGPSAGDGSSDAPRGAGCELDPNAPGNHVPAGADKRRAVSRCPSAADGR